MKKLKNFIPSAYFSSTVAEFLDASSDSILGRMTSLGQFSLDLEQRNAWEREIEILRSALKGVDGRVLLEYDVPRIGSRIDAVLVSSAVVFPIEFKVGETSFRRKDFNQVWDYALDLKNFHRASHQIPIVPILVATDAPNFDRKLPDPHKDGVYSPLRSNAAGLGDAIRLGLHANAQTTIDVNLWEEASYQPTPTIIEAAQSLYSQHTVDAISRHDAGARNLQVTSGRVESIIDRAARDKEKVIVFVTGVPGAGKTLVGLNIATERRDATATTHAVFLSGNGPLVQVLTEALARDEFARSKSTGVNARKGEIKQSIKAFIQNVHHFRDAGLREPHAPNDRVVIFDEAQRAWDRSMTSDFMVRKKRVADFAQSEPEVLISYMDRHVDWAVIVCLVGGGQEIHRGEAGISTWIDAIREGFPDWHVYVSPNLTDSEYASGLALGRFGKSLRLNTDPDLHLSVSMRSFRAETVSSFVKALLDCEENTARALFGELESRYPIVVTRDLNKAKKWIRENARGSERFGLVASSSAQRLKPHAIDVRVKIDPVHWFLNDSDDTRSSYYLEDAATEFQVQGLELDWACVTWDADLRFGGDFWAFKRFKGSKWQSVNKPELQQYLRNAYRVLLTRARQGMAIFVPEGEPTDLTRKPSYYDGTYRYLRSIGIPNL